MLCEAQLSSATNTPKLHTLLSAGAPSFPLSPRLRERPRRDAARPYAEVRAVHRIAHLARRLIADDPARTSPLVTPLLTHTGQPGPRHLTLTA